MSGLVRTLARYALAEQTAPIPDHVLHHARRALVDWFAALIGGCHKPPARIMIEALGEELGRGKSIVYGTDLAASSRTAALINGISAHTIEFDDIFRDAAYHPGSPTIAAALAAAQSADVDGEALLRAIVVGYEISTRIGVAVQPAHYRFWHTTGTIGTLGAAVAVATVLKCDETQIGHALATSVTLASGLQQAYLSEAMSKPLHSGHAADAGTLAAYAASRGFTGSFNILDGDLGFGNAMSRDVNWSVATEGLGEHYNITEMTFKSHGCCGHTFASIDGALELKNRHGIRAADIDKVLIRTYQPAIAITDRRAVSTPFDGRFSTPFTVATALLHGSVRLNAFTLERVADPEIRALSDRVEMLLDTDCDSAFPSRRSARVEITTKSGECFHHYQHTRKGDPDAPLSDEELSDKYLELAGPVIGEAAAGRLLGQLWNLGTGASTCLEIADQRSAVAAK